MQTAPPFNPAARLSAIFLAVGAVLFARFQAGFLDNPTQARIIGKMRTALQAFQRLAARIAAGTYKPRKPFTRRPPVAPRPRQPSGLPTTFGWLFALLPGPGQYRGQIEYLLQQPETAALIAIAPAEMGRIFRPVCWMLRLKPPPALAAPKRQRAASSPRPARKPAARKPAAARAAPRAAPAPVPPPPAPPAPPQQPLYDYHWLGPSYRRNV